MKRICIIFVFFILFLSMCLNVEVLSIPLPDLMNAGHWDESGIHLSYMPSWLQEKIEGDYFILDEGHYEIIEAFHAVPISNMLEGNKDLNRAYKHGIAYSIIIEDRTNEVTIPLKCRMGQRDGEFRTYDQKYSSVEDLRPFNIEEATVKFYIVYVDTEKGKYVTPSVEVINESTGKPLYNEWAIYSNPRNYNYDGTTLKAWDYDDNEENSGYIVGIDGTDDDSLCWLGYMFDKSHDEFRSLVPEYGTVAWDYIEFDIDKDTNYTIKYKYETDAGTATVTIPLNFTEQAHVSEETIEVDNFQKECDYSEEKLGNFQMRILVKCNRITEPLLDEIISVAQHEEDVVRDLIVKDVKKGDVIEVFAYLEHNLLHEGDLFDYNEKYGTSKEEIIKIKKDRFKENGIEWDYSTNEEEFEKYDWGYPSLAEYDRFVVIDDSFKIKLSGYWYTYKIETEAIFIPVENHYRSSLEITIRTQDIVNNKDFVDVGNNIDYYNPLNQIFGGESDIEEKAGTILKVITNIGIIVAILMSIILGIKYMLGSVEEKAEYKKDMLPYLIGSCLVFGICTIIKILQSFGNSINNI